MEDLIFVIRIKTSNSKLVSCDKEFSIYNPDETLFMKKGKEHGATVKNGLEMLLLQAFASWDFWHEEK